MRRAILCAKRPRLFPRAGVLPGRFAGAGHPARRYLPRRSIGWAGRDDLAIVDASSELVEAHAMTPKLHLELRCIHPSQVSHGLDAKFLEPSLSHFADPGEPSDREGS